MNRRERRQVSKRLGILDYQRKLPREKRFELIAENIIAGKNTHKEFIENVRVQQNRTEEEVEAEAIQFLANQIAQSQKIPIVDAVEMAEKQYNKRYKK